MMDELQGIWDQRYREGQPSWASPIPSAINVLLQHRSVRRFSDQPLPDHLLELLVMAAQSAPTSSNKQFWSVIAVRDTERKRRLAALCGAQAHVAEAPLLLVWLADLSRMEAVGTRDGRHLEGLDYLESFLVASMDAAFAAQNALVTAESLGLGTVYIGAMRNKPEEVAAELELPQRCLAIFGMCIGFPAEESNHMIKPRLPQQAVLHSETYSAKDIEAAVGRHDEHYKAFREEQGMEPTNWSRHIMSRVENAKALKGRDQLMQTLRRMGFPML